MAPGARAPGPVKLLLDGHHSPAVAERLQAEGYDVVAAINDAALRILRDDDLLRAATATGRAVVTEDVDDFARIARRRSVSGQHHAGIVFSLRARYYRGNAAYPGNLIAALGTLLDTLPESTLDRIFWLP